MQEARNTPVEASTREHGYIKEGDKEKLQNRLRRVEGQVRGLQRMVEEGLAFALVVAFVAAFPVNRYLISRGKGHGVVHEYHGH